MLMPLPILVLPQMYLSGFLLQGLHLRSDSNVSVCSQPHHDQPPFQITSKGIDCENIHYNSSMDAVGESVAVSVMCMSCISILCIV